MSQLILTARTGIHDAGAALFEDYNLLAAVQLERLTRLSEIIMLRSTASIALLSFDPVRSAWWFQYTAKRVIRLLFLRSKCLRCNGC